MSLGIDPEDMRALGDQIGQHLRAAVDRIAGPGVELDINLAVGETRVTGTLKIKALEEKQ